MWLVVLYKCYMPLPLLCSWEVSGKMLTSLGKENGFVHKNTWGECIFFCIFTQVEWHLNYGDLLISLMLFCSTESKKIVSDNIHVGKVHLYSASSRVCCLSGTVRHRQGHRSAWPQLKPVLTDCRFNGLLPRNSCK